MTTLGAFELEKDDEGQLYENPAWDMPGQRNNHREPQKTAILHRVYCRSERHRGGRSRGL